MSSAPPAGAPGPGLTILAVCPTCSETRYRSKIPISEASQCIPSNFEPLGDAPPPSEGAALCHVCGAMLTFTTEDRLRPRAAEAPAPPGPGEAAPPPARGLRPSPSAVAPSSEVLFAVAPGEALKDVRDVPGGLLVLTDRRIVYVRLG